MREHLRKFKLEELFEVDYSPSPFVERVVNQYRFRITDTGNRLLREEIATIATKALYNSLTTVRPEHAMKWVNVRVDEDDLGLVAANEIISRSWAVFVDNGYVKPDGEIVFIERDTEVSLNVSITTHGSLFIINEVLL